MNDLNKKNLDLIYGYTIFPEIYYEFTQTPLTKKEKRKIFFYKIKEVIVEALWHILHTIAIVLQIGGLAYLAGILFKIGTA